MDGTSQPVLPPGVVDQALAVAASTGADAVDLFAENRTGLDLRLDEGVVHARGSGQDGGVALRAWFGDLAVECHTSSLHPDDVLDCAALLVRTAPGAGEAAPGIRDGPARAGTHGAPDGRHAPHNDAAALLAAVDDAARHAGAGAVTAAFAETHRSVLVADSHGRRRSASWQRARVVTQVVFAGAGGRASAVDDIAVTGLPADLTEQAVLGSVGTACARARDQLDAQDVPAGQWPVVFAPGAGGLLVHETLGHGCESDLVLAATSPYRERLGQRLCPAAVDVRDDGSVPGAWGSFPCDDEGAAPAATTLVDGGVLVGLLTDRAGAGRLGAAVTGNGRRESFRHPPLPRMSNTYVAPGPDTAADIVGSVRRGVYCESLGGGQADPVADTFAFAMSAGWLIENGELTRPVRAGQFSGTGAQVLARVEAVADDIAFRAGTCGKDGQRVQVSTGNPTMLVSALRFGGGSDGG